MITIKELKKIYDSFSFKLNNLNYVYAFGSLGEGIYNKVKKIALVYDEEIKKMSIYRLGSELGIRCQAFDAGEESEAMIELIKTGGDDFAVIFNNNIDNFINSLQVY